MAPCCITLLLIFGILGYAIYYENQHNLKSIGDWQKHFRGETTNDSSIHEFGSGTPKMAIPFSESNLNTEKKKEDINKYKKDSFPIEWNKLKEIYPEAEIDEYADYEKYSNGNWDMDGLKEDLSIMMERTGKKPTGKASRKEKEDLDLASMSNVALRKILKEKGLPSTGVKSKLIARLKSALEKEKITEDNDTETEIDSTDEKPRKKKTGKRIVKKTIRKKKKAPVKEELDTTTIECPDCASKMEISDIPGTQEVKCPECGAEGEIEL